ncbi:hypothetical protein BO70DRAFT_427501 [Aspergillus heteromorphus CBS 117.55]|uniref:AAA+ ATPase domain-containing protein n=1 Tax=Aspergillus heteromorphus CBS 117.55 TaxID=1448321 RepID=A0A317WMI1_9EURO|nr:uncharacterized protein BO70DRAFT_427501 [Aspergillus heteromorphus CBS 117.55]PWY87579.1 hypothetical protein BO70DRAFT_427501 [Aspergillus heteromorphus CBS 117.55]
MASASQPSHESTVHTLSDHEKDIPHVILSATGDRSEYIQALEKRLEELENKVQGLLVEKSKPSEKENNQGGDGESRSSPGDDERSEAKDKSEDGKSTTSEEQEDDNKRKEVHRSIIPRAQKQNPVNFFNRFPNQIQIPVVEVLMVDTTLYAAYEEDEEFGRRLNESSACDALEMIQTQTDVNPYKPDASMTIIRINSVSVVKEIMQILSPDREFNTPLSFESPFRALIQNHDTIKERLNELPVNNHSDSKETETSSVDEDPQLSTLLQTYIEFMEEEVIPLHRTKSNKVRYNDLASVFQLGDSIYVANTGRSSKPDPEMLGQRDYQRLWRLYRIVSGTDFQLKCYAIDYDGEAYVCVKRTFDIPQFTGEQEISSLPVFPLRYAENAEKIKDECREQGRKFLEYLGTRLLSHNGWALTPESSVQSHSPLQYVTSDVVIDMAEALKAHPNWKPEWKFPKTTGDPRLRYAISIWNFSEKNVLKYDSQEGTFWNYERIGKVEYCTKTDPFLSSWFRDQGKTYKPRGGDLELLPRRLFSYVLQDRKFVAVDIRNLKPVDDHGTHSGLIIDKNHESMLRALVSSHFKRKELHDSLGAYSMNQDIITNKGRGLIILLYGVPGVGKTSTAENIAHSWKKPLLPITCGDLGTQPDAVETSLKEIFRLAQLWDCILLLDEADVFLSERTPAALERNALVSVFLRMLEYYTGILFLTTNLPGSIDEAFKSRIHISLYYPHLKRDTTLKIWDMNLQRLAAIESERAKVGQQPSLTIDSKGIKRFAKKHYRENEDGKGRWNGRQIRNAFLIASALAHFEKKDLNTAGITSETSVTYFDIRPEHFEVVADASMGFERYLLEARGRTAGENAFQRGLRADYILTSPEKLKESPYVPGHDDRQGSVSTGPFSPAPNQHWNSLAQGTGGGYVPNQQQTWQYNEGQHKGHQGTQGMLSAEQYGAQQTMGANVNSFAGQPPNNIGPQGSPSPWNTGVQQPSPYGGPVPNQPQPSAYGGPVPNQPQPSSYYGGQHSVYPGPAGMFSPGQQFNSQQMTGMGSHDNRYAASATSNVGPQGSPLPGHRSSHKGPSGYPARAQDNDTDDDSDR